MLAILLQVLLLGGFALIMYWFSQIIERAIAMASLLYPILNEIAVAIRQRNGILPFPPAKP